MLDVEVSSVYIYIYIHKCALTSEKLDLETNF